MNIYEKLMNIQRELKAPKNLYNSFGNYKYRNAEGILEAVKPYLSEYKCVLLLDDTLTARGDRLFIESTARLFDVESKEENLTFKSVISTTAMAELGEHKGMSADQATGCASSYARKYCLNALFLLDDTKDADSDEHHNEIEAKKNSSEYQNLDKITSAQMGLIKTEMAKKKIAEQTICERYKVNSLNDLTKNQASSVISSLKKTAEKSE